MLKKLDHGSPQRGAASPSAGGASGPAEPPDASGEAAGSAAAAAEAVARPHEPSEAEVDGATFRRFQGERAVLPVDHDADREGSSRDDRGEEEEASEEDASALESVSNERMKARAN